MIRVLHYDIRTFESKDFRGALSERLKREPEVVYTDLSEEFDIRQDIFEEIRRRLPEQEVLLIHPGCQNQPTVLQYKEENPRLRIAFVIPSGDGVKEYELREGLRFIPQSCMESVVNFVLGRED